MLTCFGHMATLYRYSRYASIVLMLNHALFQFAFVVAYFYSIPLPFPFRADTSAPFRLSCLPCLSALYKLARLQLVLALISAYLCVSKYSQPKQTFAASGDAT